MYIYDYDAKRYLHTNLFFVSTCLLLEENVTITRNSKDEINSKDYGIKMLMYTIFLIKTNKKKKNLNGFQVIYV